MAKIAPFAGVRYDSAVVGDLTPLVCQPYDKIDRALQYDYYHRSPNNVVRIILNDEAVHDPETPYPNAAKTLHEWLDKGILTKDKEPALYVYYQYFQFNNQTYVRKGFVASVELEEKGVRAHEHTLAGPKADRLRLLKALEVNDENIFLLFSDVEHNAVKIMDAAIANLKPVIDVKDDFGETHKVWAVTDPTAIAQIQKLVAERELFIADGHHRFETAVNYKNECLAKGWKPVGNQGFDHRMMALFPMEDPGLVIFPTHRLVKNVKDFNGNNLVAALAKHFIVEPMASEKDLFKAMDKGPRFHSFGMAVTGAGAHFYWLRLKDPKIMDKEVAGVSEASRQLDVTVLHKLILENELGIDKAKLEAFSHVEYVRHREEAVSKVGKGGIQAAFLLNPTEVLAVKAVASAGERMPQKSTDFYPKLLAGLVMMPLEMKK